MIFPAHAVIDKPKAEIVKLPVQARRIEGYVIEPMRTGCVVCCSRRCHLVADHVAVKCRNCGAIMPVQWVAE